MTKPLGYRAALALLLVAATGLLVGRPAALADDAPSAKAQPILLPPVASLAAMPNSDVATLFASKVRPLVAEYCLACHSTKVKKGELDLERFVSIDVARSDLKPWQSVVEMLDAGEMPPKSHRQPTADERRWLIAWTQRWLDLEARSRAGDPGAAALRRLSNAEYNCTVRDLTGVDLQPAKEFPADGAAGEGFTNAAEALSMPSALFDKYLAAAKGIADHAVFLPDGFRFSPSSHQRDWVDESLGAMHRFYNRYVDSDGRIPVERYLAATIRHRAAIEQHTKSFAEIARQENISAKYLEIFWNMLSDRRPSLVLDGIRRRWRAASVAGAPAIAADIVGWEKLAWTIDDVAAGIYEPWQMPSNPIGDSRQYRLKITPAAGQKVVTLYLVARTIDGIGSDRVSDSKIKSAAKPPIVIWDNPRFEADRQPAILLRDVPIVAEAMNGSLTGLFRDTAKYLAAAAEWRRGGIEDSVAAVAKRHAVNPNRLQHWIDALSLGRDAPGSLEPLEIRVPGSADRPLVQGWRTKNSDLPILLTNATNRTEAIPGTLPGHKVVVHPSPDEYVAVAWNSPIAGRVRIEAKVSDAHAGCGNGVAWWVDQQHLGHRQKLTGGEFDDGKAAAVDPQESIIEPGDVVCLGIAARDHDDGCDLTLVDLTVTELDGLRRTWNLSADVADSVLQGNPHMDRFGNQKVWLFAKGRDTSPQTPRVAVPADSLLGKWRDLVDRPSRQPDEAKLAAQIESLMTGAPPPADGRPNSLLFASLLSSRSPLVDPSDVSAMLSKQFGSKMKGSPYGLDASNWGKVARDQGTGARGQKTGDRGQGPGDRGRDGKVGSGNQSAAIPESAFGTVSPAVLKIQVPAALVANHDFVVDTRLASSNVGNRLVQLQVLTAPPTDSELSAIESNRLIPSPLICSTQGPGRTIALHGLDDFRQIFPSEVCFARIVPEDPNGITLCLFAREDQELSRLLLDAPAQKQLNYLWRELKYVGRQAQKEEELYPLFMGFASQVGLVPRFTPLGKPLQLKAEAFKKELEASEPSHLNQLLDFASQAYRRPLSSAEKSQLLNLYTSLRKKKHVTHEDAMRGVLARVLIAPEFLFHLEQPPSGKEPKPIDDWELANRLSYFLWSSMPDEELRQAAAAGRLHDPRILAEQTTRMLHSPKVRSLAIEFGTQWIHVRGFDEMNEKNERLFPTFDATLRADIYEESILFFQDLFQSDRPLDRILNADYTFLNDRLAKHYGIPNVVGPQWRRVDGVQKYGRGGVLALASMLANESAASRTSPTLRGAWVSETLLGEKLPRPPPNVPKIRDEETGKDGRSVRQIVEQHAKVAQCAVCHVRIDPIGFSLENYDAIGRFRQKDAGGAPIDCHAKLKDGTQFDGLAGLRIYLLRKKHDVVVRLFCRRLLGYALGRETNPSDAPTIDAMIDAMNKNGGRLSAAVLAIVSSPQFRLIRGSDFLEVKE